MRLTRKISVLSLFIFTLTLGLTQQIHAQSGRISTRERNSPSNQRAEAVPKEPRNKSALMNDLWFGGGFNLGFSGNQFESLFGIGISPMVGYKITPDFSVGPRIVYSYQYYAFQDFSTKQKFNLHSFGIGPFARFKIFNAIFLHGEYLIESRQFAFRSGPNFDKATEIIDSFYLGLGYNTGGTELLLLYNFLNNNRQFLSSPFDFRFGFTYNF
jgi:hypothetical protein